MSSGSGRLGPLCAGSYQLQVIGRGVAAETIPFTIERGVETKLDVPLSAGAEVTIECRPTTGASSCKRRSPMPGGKTTLTWFTVPYNREQVKTLPNGQDWHLGFAALEVGMPLTCGNVPIATGEVQAQRRARSEGRVLGAGAGAGGTGRGHAQPTARPGQDLGAQEGICGTGNPRAHRAAFSLFADFGELHRRLDLQETFKPKDAPTGPKK